MPRISALNGHDRHGPARALATSPLAQNPLSRTCPKCEAGPAQPCRRWIAGRVKGHDIGGGQWKRLKGVHGERQNKRPRTKTEPTSTTA